jgi:hypothetical protein
VLTALSQHDSEMLEIVAQLRHWGLVLVERTSEIQTHAQRVPSNGFYEGRTRQNLVERLVPGRRLFGADERAVFPGVDTQGVSEDVRAVRRGVVDVVDQRSARRIERR